MVWLDPSHAHCLAPGQNYRLVQRGYTLCLAQNSASPHRVDAEEPINAGYDLIGSLLTEIGTQKMQNYFKTNPPNSEKERQRVLAAFSEHYANPDEVGEETTLPGWTNDLLTRLSDLYDKDVNAIIPRGDVKVIEPAL